MTDPANIAKALTPAQREWTQPMRDRCQDECAEYGDPPCWRLHELTSDCPVPLAPCGECRAMLSARTGEE